LISEKGTKKFKIHTALPYLVLISYFMMSLGQCKMRRKIRTLGESEIASSDVGEAVAV
jgi:hypothetical protein